MPTRKTALEGTYTDPVNPTEIPPLMLDTWFINDVEGLVGLRALLAHGRRPVSSIPTWQREAMGEVCAALGEHTTSVLILDRTSGTNFLAHIPGPGELVGDLPEVDGEWLILPFDAPMGGCFLFFDDFSGLSSCRDYVILGTLCINCQDLRKTTGNLCADCTLELDLERLMVASPMPDSLENSYGEQPQPL